nr:RNA binding protein 18 [Hymenolepis microstoma]
MKEDFSKSVDPRRIWISNLPPKSTEYAILQLVRPFGKILDFNFPVNHCSGPLQGSTLGYCFVTYDSDQSALNAMKSLNHRVFAGAVLSAQRARPTREILDHLRLEREEAKRMLIEEELKRREEEVAERLNTDVASSSAVLVTANISSSFKDARGESLKSSSSSTVVPDLYGQLGLISAKPCASQLPPPPKMSRAQNRQAVSRIEAALEAASKMDIQPAIFRTNKTAQKPHPLVTALLGRGAKSQQQNDRDRKGRLGCGSNYHQRSHPYARL